MKKEITQPQIQDPETEAQEFEQLLKHMAKTIAEDCARPGKSGLTFTQFKAQYLKNLASISTPLYASH